MLGYNALVLISDCSQYHQFSGVSVHAIYKVCSNMISFSLLPNLSFFLLPIVFKLDEISCHLSIKFSKLNTSVWDWFIFCFYGVHWKKTGEVWSVCTNYLTNDTKLMCLCANKTFSC